MQDDHQEPLVSSPPPATQRRCPLDPHELEPLPVPTHNQMRRTSQVGTWHDTLMEFFSVESSYRSSKSIYIKQFLYSISELMILLPPDETSSGVASLDGNESSGEAWDVEEQSCNPTSTASSTPSTIPDASHTALTPSSVTESKIGDFNQFDQQSLIESPNSSPAMADIHSRVEPSDTSKSTCSKSIHQEESAGPHFVYEPSSVQGSTAQATSFTSTMRASTSGNPTETMKPQVSGQFTPMKNPTQPSKGTSQSPIISSTVTSQVSSTPQASVGTGTQSEREDKCYIPRLIDGPVKDGSKVQPKLWSPQDVAQFLKTNDCGAYCDNFVSQVSCVGISTCIQSTIWPLVVGL